jgi:predicted lysophospholipase L1 biosynthesis ABC-type transport system permease subunit
LLVVWTPIPERGFSHWHAGVDATVFPSVAGTATSLLVAVVAATLLPIRLATRTDPLLALRGE